MTKYLVEWDRDSDFDRGIASPAASRSYAYVTDWAHALSAADAGNYSDLSPYQYQITGLDKGAVYHARVSAYNAEGYGPVSPASEATTFGQPGPPQGALAAIGAGSALAVG